jgi:hypothetical protein
MVFVGAGEPDTDAASPATPPDVAAHNACLCIAVSTPACWRDPRMARRTQRRSASTAECAAHRCIPLRGRRSSRATTARRVIYRRHTLRTASVDGLSCLAGAPAASHTRHMLSPLLQLPQTPLEPVGLPPGPPTAGLAHRPKPLLRQQQLRVKVRRQILRTEQVLMSPIRGRPRSCLHQTYEGVSRPSSRFHAHPHGSLIRACLSPRRIGLDLLSES